MNIMRHVFSNVNFLYYATILAKSFIFPAANLWFRQVLQNEVWCSTPRQMNIAGLILKRKNGK